MAITKSKKYIIFYQASTNKIFGYQLFEFAYDDVLEKYINLPDKQRCADNHGIDISDIGIKKWNKDLTGLTLDEQRLAFKDLITDLDVADLEDLN
ncbi:MAG: hypothetical protein DRJ38_05465 [Thermoprotei archaeon]|nr:MAG: hypothetical protein DRJ38_05465 [Thermoprotei archaeon]